MTTQNMTYVESYPEVFRLTVARLFVACNFEPNTWLEEFIEVMCMLAGPVEGEGEGGLEAIIRMLEDGSGDGLETLHDILLRAWEAHLKGDDLAVARLICEWQPNVR